MYRAPVEEIAFTLKHVAGLKEAIETGSFGELSEDLADAILAEAGRFASEEVAPLAKVGDAEGATLEGATVTIAGATLLQRVSGAVTKFGGNVLSTQLDLQGTQSRTGFLSMIASCEIDQPELQKLLYDLEAGMPFLFIDQLVVQPPLTMSGTGGGRLRLLLTVSGQWRGTK